MKQLSIALVGLCVVAAHPLIAQEVTSNSQWHSQQTFQQFYQPDSQGTSVNRQFAQHMVLSSHMTMVVGFSHQQTKHQSYDVEHIQQHQSTAHHGSSVAFYTTQGTALKSALHSHSKLGRIQKMAISQQLPMGPVQWQLDYANSRLLDSQQNLEHWSMGIVWQPGAVQAKLMVQQGHRNEHLLTSTQDSDTRATLDLEKTFGF